MKLRTRLVITFFLIAVVPLAVIVMYSYSSSLRAFRGAVEAETREQAEDLRVRVSSLRRGLLTGVSRASRLPIMMRAGASGEVQDEQLLQGEIRAGFGGLAPFVEAVEFVPVEVPGPEVEPQPPLPKSNLPQPKAEAPSQGLLVVLERERPPRLERRPERPAEPEQEGLGAVLAQVIDEGAEVAKEAIRNAEELSRAEKEEIIARGEEVTERLRAIARYGGDRLVEEAVRATDAMDEIDFERLTAEGERLREQLASTVPILKRLDLREMIAAAQRRQEVEAVLGDRFGAPVEEGHRLVGHVYAHVQPRDILEAVLANVSREGGEIPFAIDETGALYTVDPYHQDTVEGLLRSADGADGPPSTDSGWIVSQIKDDDSETSFGIARPVGQGLEEIRRTAVRNLSFGLLLVGLAAWGILPISRRMTRNLATLTSATEALAAGDLEARVPVRSRDEFGRLAKAFNSMAEDLGSHQQRLLEEEKQRQEHELRNRLLEVEYERKTRELESAREFQLSMLPGSIPERADLAIAVAMRTATEVGGDYYDFRPDDDGALTIVVGDATGHGAAAGTMVTVIKSLFAAEGGSRPVEFLARADGAIRRMELGRMLMALTAARLADGLLTVSAAGMPPLLVHRAASGRVDEVVVAGLPLGALKGARFSEAEVELAAGDTVLMLSDGFPELLNEEGEPLGYERAVAAFAGAAHRDPEDVIAALEEVADRWRGGRAQADDITFVVLRARGV